MSAELLITIVTVACGVAGFFFSLRYAINRLSADVHEAVDRLSQQMDRMGRHSGEEHRALLKAVEKMSDHEAERHEKLLDAMNRDHRDMNEKVGDIRTTTAKIDAKLDAHTAEQRKG